jgi:hypothetical protein
MGDERAARARNFRVVTTSSKPRLEFRRATAIDDSWMIPEDPARALQARSISDIVSGSASAGRRSAERKDLCAYISSPRAPACPSG